MLTVRQTKNPNYEATSHIIRAGGKETISFAVHISNPGVYLLSFRGVVAPDEKLISVEAGVHPTSGVSWTATKYITITHEPSETSVSNVLS